MAKKKTNTNYVGVPQYLIDQGVQEYLAKTNQLDTINANQSKATQTVGLNVKTILPKVYTTATFINQDDSATNSDNDVYIVPSGKIFILTFAFLNVCNTNGILSLGSTGRLRYSNNGCSSYTALLRFMGPPGVAFSNNQGLTPSALMIFDAGTIFNVSSSNNALAATASVMGYEISEEEYNRLI